MDGAWESIPANSLWPRSDFCGSLPSERVARVNLPNMHWSPKRKVEVYARAIRGLLQLEPDPNRQSKYVDFIDSYAALSDNERSEYEQRFPK